MKMLKEKSNENVGALIHEKKKESDNTKTWRKWQCTKENPKLKEI